MMYGLDQEKRKVSRTKIRNTKSYMDNNFIKIGDNEIPYSFFFKNAFINANRYIAEIQNRVWSIYNYAESRNLVNVFCTITCPPEFHRLKKLSSGKIVRNRKYNTDYNPRYAVKYLSKSLKKILDDYFYKSIPREDRCYFRVTEPHHDGTPHLHISFFIPEDKVEKFVKLFNRHFPAPLGKIETNVENPVSYLMKYVLKTLDDLRFDSENLSDLTLWYVYWGICRIYTSRTLISLDVYRVLGGRYSLNELTVMYKEKRLTVYVEPTTNKVLQIFDEFGGRIFSKKLNLNLSKSKIYNNAKPCLKSDLPKPKPSIPIFNDSQKRIANYFKGDLLPSFKQYIAPSSLSDPMLLRYFYSLDIVKTPFVHYQLTKNECIKRCLIKGQIETLNALKF